MISKTQINKRKEKKRNPEIVEAIELAKKNNLLDIAKKLSSPKKNYRNLNLDEIDKINEEKIVLIGKVLSQGEIKNKKEIFALGFSERAKDKLKKFGCKTGYLKEILKNKKIEGAII